MRLQRGKPSPIGDELLPAILHADSVQSYWKKANLPLIYRDQLTGGKIMTNRVGNKNQAQMRGKQERKGIKQANRVREAEKRATARARYRNAVKGQAQAATA